MWYSSQIFIKTKDTATHNDLVHEHASEPREKLDHKARYSELSTRRLNSRMKNFDQEILSEQSDELHQTKKISKPILLVILLIVTLIGISGQHLLPYKFSSFSEILEFFNVEAFETSNNESFTLTQNEPNLTDHSNLSSVSKIRSTPNPKFSRSLVLLDLEDWRKNWSSKNLNNFMAYYHPEFPDLKIFKNNKKRIFKKAKYIRISLKNIESRVEGNNIITGFTQIYKSKNYNDSSVKELTWSKTKTGWKIIEEKKINSNVAKRGRK